MIIYRPVSALEKTEVELEGAPTEKKLYLTQETKKVKVDNFGLSLDYSYFDRLNHASHFHLGLDVLEKLGINDKSTIIFAPRSGNTWYLRQKTSDPMYIVPLIIKTDDKLWVITDNKNTRVKLDTEKWEGAIRLHKGRAEKYLLRDDRISITTENDQYAIPLSIEDFGDIVFSPGIPVENQDEMVDIWKELILSVE